MWGVGWGCRASFFLCNEKKRRANSPFAKYVGIPELGFSPRALNHCVHGAAPASTPSAASRWAVRTPDFLRERRSHTPFGLNSARHADRREILVSNAGFKSIFTYVLAPVAQNLSPPYTHLFIHSFTSSLVPVALAEAAGHQACSH